ncbi:hypothetical protein C6P40_004573 [Pichia californica]|uniref:Sphingoid long-chain base transporter RSB1 n=1 Tax=Pichia californica TaxID=460514 RepID=A0A9P7BG86_9ASCO|nr:hypothetical protein C6P42_003491 [[Candida] californica]KAG0689716.1 hypothetical protein C6P40_004573 [[Candida] californica]
MDTIELISRKFIDGDTPKLASGIGYVIVFSIFYTINLIECVYYHQWWFLNTWGIGLLLEIIGYSGRIWYTINDNSSKAYIMELVCITVAPCFLMAGIYYILAQLILIFGNHFSFLKPMNYSLIFIICDVISIFVQAAGGGISDAPSSREIGRYVMIGGLAFQVLTISIFQFFWYSFLWKVRKSKKEFNEEQFNPIYHELRNRKKFKKLIHFYLLGISITVILVYTRSIYRLIETSSGWLSHLSTKEIYFDILEGLMIGLSALIMVIFSPGVVYGKHANLYIKKNGFDYYKEKDNDFTTISSTYEYKRNDL